MGLLTKPLLDKPAPGWSHDLAGPNEPCLTKPCAHALPNSPNHLDEIFLELPRSTDRVRGVGVWLAILLAPIAIGSVVAFFEAIISDDMDVFLCLGLLVSFVSSFWGGIYMWRMDTCAPRDEPIRFNRVRRKVYVYRFYHDGWRPFSKAAWFTRAEVYEWDDIRAEACSTYGPMGSGGLMEVITLAVLESGTNKALDRFHFAHGGLQGEMYWALAQLYMQQGPDAMPEFEYLPRDWNNEDVTLNLARYLAPKVKWPEQIDLESRTAP